MLPCWPAGRLKLRYLVALLVVTFLCGMVLGIAFITSADNTGKTISNRHRPLQHEEHLQQVAESLDTSKERDKGNKGQQNQLPDTMSSKSTKKTYLPLQDGEKAGMVNTENKSAKEHDAAEMVEVEPNYNVHVFYYPWYGTPDREGQYYHWNHEMLPHWDPKEARKWPKGRHVPPDDVGASFYPALGPYSSSDPDIIDNHMRQIRSAGVGTIAVSWYPPNTADDAGKKDMPDSLVSVLLNQAHKFQLKICLHIEPYKGRNHITLRQNLKYIHDKYGSHPAFYKYRNNQGQLLPLFYIYDSYLVKPSDWAAIFKRGGHLSVRETNLDGVFIGLLVDPKHKKEIIQDSGFDGYYTYFASEAFTFGSRVSNWEDLQGYAQSKNALFIPSIGPGYNDERVRPWNAHNSKSRENGEYYERMFRAALNVNPPIISITSFNEWHEGSQIEKAVPKSIPDHKYLDYAPKSEDYYLSLTRTWVFKFKRHSKASNYR